MAHFQVPFSLYMWASTGTARPETWTDTLTSVAGRDLVVPGMGSAATSWLLMTPIHFIDITSPDVRQEMKRSLLIRTCCADTREVYCPAQSCAANWFTHVSK